MSGVLTLRGLEVTLPGTPELSILRDIDLAIRRDRAVGLVGESGSGKTTLALALMGLLPPGARVAAREVAFAGEVLSGPADLSRLRGREIAMVFQDPMTALSPMFSIGTQMVDAQRRRHPTATRRALADRATRTLARVGVPDAEARLKLYPHQFSGGMRQRVLIAMALLTEPALLIADEPTTALDATIELQIVELLRELKQDLNGALLLVSHSLGLIAETCDDVVVLYAGRVMESGPVAAVLDRPAHPYTRALLACEIDPIAPVAPGSPLVTIPGTVPDPTSIGDGCAFASRCAHAGPRCAAAPPHRRAGEGHSFACWLDVSELAA